MSSRAWTEDEMTLHGRNPYVAAGTTLGAAMSLVAEAVECDNRADARGFLDFARSKVSSCVDVVQNEMRGPKQAKMSSLVAHIEELIEKMEEDL